VTFNPEVNVVLLAGVSYSWPVLAGALWWLMRRSGRSPVMAPLLFATLVGSAILMVTVGERGPTPALAALAAGLCLTWAALFDFIVRDDEPPDADDDDGNGGGGWTPPPAPPRGGLGRDPDWWPEFERAFSAHVAGGAASAGPVRSGSDTANSRRDVRYHSR
jgi:hypothetical protein